MKKENYFAEEKKQKSHKKITWFLLILLIASLALTPLGFNEAKVVMAENAENGQALLLADEENQSPLTPAEIYEKHVHATVGITSAVFQNVWGFETAAAATGSGFILTKDGYVITNLHVIRDSEDIVVTDYEGNEYDAKLVGYDKSNDIALLKIEADNLQTVTVGDSDKIKVGDPVYAIGNPFGELTFSLTDGIVSALGREITVEGGLMVNLIQTNAAINSGNSGGALFNQYGEVIGITNAKYSGRRGDAPLDNIGFAIPMNNVKDIIESLITNGYVAKPYIGISIKDVNRDMLSYGLPAGTVVVTIEKDSPAEKAGLQKTDIITAVDGEELNDSKELIEAILKAGANTEVTLSVFRKGKIEEIKLTIGEDIRTLEDLEKEREEERKQEKQQELPDGLPWFFGFDD